MKKLLNLFTALPLVAILMFSSLVFADTGDIVVEGKPVTGKIEVGGGTLELPNSDTLPGTCAVGDTYVLTSALSGSQYYVCESANVWIPQGSFYGVAYFPDYNETDQGITGDGKSAKAYIDTIAADSATLVFRHNSGTATTTYTFSTDETIPDNINVVIEKGAILSIDNTKTLTIDNFEDPGLNQVFNCVGTGKVVFGNQAIQGHCPEWWGAVGDGATDDYTPMQAYFTALDNPTIPSGKIYTIGTLLTVSRSNFNLTLNGTIKWKANTAGGIIEIRGTTATNILPNGDFTVNTDGWSSATGTLASVGGGQSGNCLEITRISGTTQIAGSTTIYTSLTTGKVYKLTAWVKSGTSGNESFKIGMSYPNPGDNPYGEIAGMSSSVWTEYSSTFKQVGTGGATICHLMKNSATAGTMLFDSITITEYPSPNYISNVSVSGTGIIDGNRDNQTGASTRHGIGFRYINGVSVSGITVKMVGNLAGGAAYGKGVYAANCTNVRINENYFYGNILSIGIAEQSSENPAISLPTDSGEDVQITNNYIDQFSTLYAGVDGISVQTKRSTLISGNIVKNITGGFLGIWTNSIEAGNGVKGVISNNVLYNTGAHGIAAESDVITPNASYWVITGNHIDTVTTTGIGAFGKSIISNNIILNAGYTGIGTSGGDDTLISGNYIINESGVAGYGILGFYAYGITTKNISIIGNIVKGFTSGGVGITTDGTAGTVIDGAVVSNNQTDGDMLIQKYVADPYGVRYAVVIGNVYKTWNAGSVVDTVDGCIVQHNVDLP